MTSTLPQSSAPLAPRNGERVRQRLVQSPCDFERIESLLDAHLWIVEEELRMCIGRPPWFDSALCFVSAEIVRDFRSYRPAKKCLGNWIRRRATRASQMLERALATRYTEKGIVKFTNDETFVTFACSVIERKRSLFWEELRLPQTLSLHCGPPRGWD